MITVEREHSSIQGGHQQEAEEAEEADDEGAEE